MAIQFNHEVIPTPIDTVNVLSMGGIRVGSMVQLSGPPASGKSSFAYSVAGMTQQTDPKCEVYVLDPEASTDYVRLVYTFGCDPERVNVINCPTLEQGFSEIAKITELSKKDKILRIVIWDSIAASVPAADFRSYHDEKSSGNMYSSGMSLRPRIVSHFVGQAMASVATSRVVCFIINQARAKIGVYNPSGATGTSGGFALSHSFHTSITFNLKQKLFDEAKGINVGTTTRVAIEKSKFGATSKKIHIWIDDTIGGKIQEGSDIIDSCVAVGVIKGHRKWWHFAVDEDKPDCVKYRWCEADRLSPEDKLLVGEGTEDVRKRAIEELTKYYRCNFYTLDMSYKLAGNPLGAPTAEDRERYGKLSIVSQEASLVYEDGTTRSEGRYKSDDLYAMSQVDLIALYNEIVSHNQSMLKYKFDNDTPSKRELINILIKNDISTGSITDGIVVSDDIRVDTVTDDESALVEE